MDAEILKLWFGFLTTFGPSVVLPILVLYFSGKQSRRIKKLEQDFEINKISASREMEIQYNGVAEKKQHEKIVHSSLIKILFEVQKLHISLSGNCVDFKCLEDATKDFLSAFSRYQTIISDNQIYLSPGVTNELYVFYKTLGELMIEIKDLQESENYEIAIVPVYNFSTKLADSIVNIQSTFIQVREDLVSELKETELKAFRTCCGQPPSEKLKAKYEELKISMEELPDPLPDTLRSTRSDC